MRFIGTVCIVGLSAFLPLLGHPLLSQPLLAQSPLVEHSGGAEEAICDKAAQEEWFDDAWTCAQNGRGLAIAAPHEAAILAKTLNDAAVEFETYFGDTTGRVAVIGSSNLPQSAVDFMKDHGYRALPWLSAVAKRQLQVASIERQVMAQTQSLPEERRQAILAQALAQLGGDNPEGETLALAKPTAIELGALGHEAGHLLFTQFYDGDPKPSDGERRYGSTGPDWLDELAAVLLESEPLTQSRYAIAREQLTEGEPGYPLPLDDYLTMVHPSFAAAEALRKRAGLASEEGAVAIALSGEEARKFLEESGGDPVQFYVQSRLLADFLIEQSGDQKVIAQIASEIRSGGTFETWLARHHEAHGFAPDVAGDLAGDLTGDMASFVKAWDAWITRRLADED